MARFMKSANPTSAAAVQKKFLDSLRASYDDLPPNYRVGA
jgi:hypothetical protein